MENKDKIRRGTINAPNGLYRRLSVVAVLLGAGFLYGVAEAQVEGPGSHSLWNPVPKEALRPLSADRPDITESPYTVDAGHFQLEMDFATYGYDRYREEAPRRVEELAIAPLNLKVGLNDRTDFQFVMEPYRHVRLKGRNDVEHRRGFGDITGRLKVNVWGNDGGATALGVMPFVKVPTNQDDLGNDAVEGGLIVPFAVELPAGWDMGLMSEVDAVEDGDGSGYHAEFVHSAVVGHGIVGDLSGYSEFVATVSTEAGSDWEGLVGVGLTYLLSRDIQLDGGVNLGVTRAAEDVKPFMGLTWRF